MIVANDCLILRIFQIDDRATREEMPMDVIDHQQTAREAQRMQANREELVERIGRAIREYKSLFGVPPMRDVQRMRQAAQDQASR